MSQTHVLVDRESLEVLRHDLRQLAFEAARGRSVAEQLEVLHVFVGLLLRKRIEDRNQLRLMY